MIDNERDYVKLLDLLGRVLEANKGPLTGTDDRVLDAENLANKFFDNAASVLYLSRGTKIELSISPSGRLEFLDPGSMDVLARAAFETFLVFHYLFVAPVAHKEKVYRYLAWKASGLAERQRLTVSRAEDKQKLAKEREEINELHKKLKSNAIFQQLTDKQQQRVLKGEWRLLPDSKGRKSWSQIAREAGLARILYSDMYRHLSGYAHSGSLSVLQTKQAILNKEQLILVKPTLGLVTIIAANFIRGYCHLFRRANTALTADIEGRKMVRKWIQIGQTLDTETSLADSDKNPNG